MGAQRIDMDNPTQVNALADILAGMGDLLGADQGQDGVAQAEALLGGVATLAQDLLGDLDLATLGGLVDLVGIDGCAQDLLAAVGSLLSQGGDPDQLTAQFGDGAAGLAQLVESLLGAYGS
jgi:hypothetical protein